jgi:phospholipid N-methyltransferase
MPVCFLRRGTEEQGRGAGDSIPHFTNNMSDHLRPATSATSSGSPGGWREGWRFFGAFLRRPGTIGAVWPSSPALARCLLEGHDLARARVVVELGPGTGAFTRFIDPALGPDTLALALEVDGQAVERLRRDYPRWKVIHDSAERIAEHLAAYGAEQADAILSGVPWASMPPALQETILSQVARVLAPEGRFSTFTYVSSPWTRRGAACAQLLRRLFARVETSPVVWRNFPPAFVYHCQQPR